MRFMTRVKSLVFVASLVAVLALTAHSAPGKGGGGKPGSPSATLTFSDAAGDAVQSDGLGAYACSVEFAEEDSGPEVILTIKKGRDLFLDFSDCDAAAGLSCDGAFEAGTSTGWVSSAIILTLERLRGAPDTVDSINALMEFQTGEGRWRLRFRVDVQRLQDDDGDGTADRYTLLETDEFSATLGKFANRRPRGSSGYIDHGRFFMPWSAAVHIQ